VEVVCAGGIEVEVDVHVVVAAAVVAVVAVVVVGGGGGGGGVGGVVVGDGDVGNEVGVDGGN
jgi:hypothetical protein